MHESNKGYSSSEADYLSKTAVKKWCEQYDFRGDLGHNKRGDGYKYRGVGYLQVTGKKNLTEFGKSINNKNVATNGTDYIIRKNLLWQASTFWWHMNKMNSFVKKGTSVQAVTTKIYGGIDKNARLSNRISYYNKCKNVFK